MSKNINLHKYIWIFINNFPVGARSKAWVCGHSLAGIAGSNPAGGMDVCLLWVLLCQVEISESGWSLVERSPTEFSVSNWVWSWSPDNEESPALYGLLCHWKNIINN
jgi:hypothetical protein